MRKNRPGWPFLLWLFAILLIAGGCTLGPDYRTPDLATIHGDEWRGDPDTGERTSLSMDAPVAGWWEQFDDPALTRLVGEVVEKNLDLAKARERIVEVGLRRHLAGADRLPYVNLDGKIIHAGTGEKAVNRQGPAPGKDATLYSAGGFAGWEPDFWGQVTRLVEVADRSYEAELDTYRYAAVSLTAEIVLAYIDVRAFEERLGVLESNIELVTKSLELVELKYRMGTSTELDVIQIRRQLNRTKSLEPEMRRARSVAANRIAILLGMVPAEYHLASGTLMDVPERVGVGLPADLITRRADVRRMERQYAAVVAAIGSAEADKYPRLSISGYLYFQTDDLDILFQPESIIYSLGPSLSFPLFDGSKLQTKVEIRESQAEQARLELEKTLLAAVGEVENGIVGVIHNQERVGQLSAAVDDGIRSVELADQLYRTGLGSLFLLMDAQRELIGARDELLLAKQFELGEIVRLYRALGGGWNMLDREIVQENSIKRGM
jgi:NodT family efflux transporter outer membrane factor (OMF) lipoprotein